MSWFLTLVVAVITAIAGFLLAGFVASLAVDWYQISSFEGGSGYYVVFLAIGGFIAGLIIGLITSRLVAAGAHPGFLRAQGFSLAGIVGLIVLIGGVGRLLADVAPTIDGETLMLVVEARYPAEQQDSPATVPGLAYVELGSVNASRVQRNSERGALWKEDARRVDGRWTVTGAVPIYTTRGSRSLQIALNDSVQSGFILPMHGSPSRSDTAWSDWFPREGRNGPPRDSGVTYRYRVQKRSAPVRTELFGPFTVSAIVNGFAPQAAPGTTTLDADATFEVAYRGKRVQFEGDTATTRRIGTVAVLPGPAATLLLIVAPENDPSYCTILSEQGDSLHELRIGECAEGYQPREVTTSTQRFRASHDLAPAGGRLDRNSWTSAEAILFPNVLLETSPLAIHRYTATTDASDIPAVPPLGLSPDRRSFVQYTLGYTGGESEPLLRVTDVMADTAYQLTIDPLRMRYPSLEALDPDWVMHHFRWQRGSSGRDYLAARSDFVPIPYYGALSTDSAGVHEFRIEKAGPAVRLALVKFLEQEFHATREAVDSSAYEYPLTIEGKRVMVANSGDFAYVLVELARGESTSDLVPRIAAAFNKALATGRYDQAFIASTTR